MKLRCVQNSIRLRVRKSDLEKLATDGIVEESITFGPEQVFQFALKTSALAEAIQATFDKQGISVILPQKEAHSWIGSPEVGLETKHPLDNNETLHILIEKDFPCIDRTDENKADTFWELVPDAPDAC